MYYWFARFVLKCFALVFAPPKGRGLEHLPAEGGVLLVANHISYLDPVLIGVVSPRKLGYMARETLFHNKVLGFFLRAGNAFAVKRGEGDIKALRECIRRVKGGEVVLIFPEGTRHADKKTPQQGVGFLAVQSKAPVIPVFIQGSDHVLQPGKKFPKRHSVTVTFGPPVTVDRQKPYPEIAADMIAAIYAIQTPPA